VWQDIFDTAVQKLFVVVWRKCPPLVFLLTSVISIVLYIINVYLCSRRPEERREERREERALLPPALGSYKSESRLQYRLGRLGSGQGVTKGRVRAGRV